MTKSNNTDVIVVNSYINMRTHLAIIYFLISWPIIYLICFVTRQEWFVGYGGYLSSFGGGNGTKNNSSNPSFNNSILSDEGRQNILWVSLLFALLVGLLSYFLLYYF